MSKFRQVKATSWLLVAMMGFSHWALAEKPDWAGKGGGKHGERQERHERRDHDRDGEQRGDRSRQASNQQPRVGGYFGDRQRTELRNYYREQARNGRCPPGLARKNNGCLPPGQARKWRTGQPLPRDVSYVPVEPVVQARLGVPPPGHEFVRVASDILLIAVGTGLVIDAIQDLGY